MKNNNNDAQIYLNAGTSKYNSEDFDGAIENLSKALEINPNLFDAYRFRGCKIFLKRF